MQAHAGPAPDPVDERPIRPAQPPRLCPSRRRAGGPRASDRLAVVEQGLDDAGAAAADRDSRPRPSPPRSRPRRRAGRHDTRRRSPAELRGTTVAPCATAISTERSVEPLSTTITPSHRASGSAPTAAPAPRSGTAGRRRPRRGQAQLDARAGWFRFDSTERFRTAYELAWRPAAARRNRMLMPSLVDHGRPHPGRRGRSHHGRGPARLPRRGGIRGRVVAPTAPRPLTCGNATLRPS